MYNCRNQFFLSNKQLIYIATKRYRPTINSKVLEPFPTVHFEAEIYLNQQRLASANSLNMEACSGS